MVTLREINRNNWEECINLKVRPEQQKFVASNLYSIAEVQFLHTFEAMAVYNDEIMIGFVMYGLDEDDQNYWIYRLMIDEQFQGLGYGREALLQVIDRVKLKPDCHEVIIGYQPENIGAEKTYIQAGFKLKGMTPWGERLVSYKVQ